MKSLYSLIIIMLAFTATVKAQVSEQEFQALKALYNSTNGDKWKNRTGWENINTTATKDDVTKAWYGLGQIIDGHITKLQLYENNLTGALPEEIGNLSYLTVLWLSGNKIDSQLPQSLENLSNMKEFSIYPSKLNSPFPANLLEHWPNIEKFWVAECGLTGTIPDIFEKTPNLYSINISGNLLEGELPESLNLLEIREFNCNNNKLTGELPRFKASTYSREFHFEWNNFTGAIPEVYGEYVIQTLRVVGNKLSGAIPEGIFTPSTYTIRLEQNYFTFYSIEPIYNKLNAVSIKSFKPSKKLPIVSNQVSANENESIILNASLISAVELGGNNNRYKWFKNNVEIYSGNSPIYTKTPAMVGDAGTYRFEVTNTVVTDFILNSENITLSIVGNNSSPTNIVLSKTNIDENVKGLVGRLSAIDPNAGDTHTFSKATGDGVNDKDFRVFNISGDSLYMAGNTDFETFPSLNVYIAANDGKGGIFNKAFVITVNNVNEAPVYNGQLTSNTIDENATNGSTALTLLAQDPEGTPVVFAITAGNDDGAFGIDGNKLIVANKTKLNYNIKNQYNLSVRASDGEMSSTAILIISLNKINQIPQLENKTFSIAENSAVGTVVGSVTATDREGDPLTYTILTGNELSAFAFTGNTLKVTNSEALNYETRKVFNLNINVSDGVSNVQGKVTINLNNIVELTDNAFTTFSVPGMEGAPEIDYITHTVKAFVKDVDLRTLTAVFTLSSEATSNPVSGTTIDFTTPKTINVTAQTGGTQPWLVTVAFRVGKNEVNNSKYNIYPNPTSGILNINGLTQADEIKIISTTGEVIIQKRDLSEIEFINLHNLKQGVYFIVISSDNHRTIQKIIKL